MERPIRKYRTDLMKGDDFTVKSALMLREAEAGTFAESVHERFEAEKGSGLPRQIGLILLGTETTEEEDLASLGAFKDRAAVAPYELYLLRRLPEDARAGKADVLREAEARVYAGPRKEAVAAFERLDKAGGLDDARLSFLYGLMTARAGDTAAAADRLRRTADRYPDDPWGEVAAELAGALKAADANTDRQVDALAAFAENSGARMGQLQIKGRLTVKGKPVDVYLGVVGGGRLAFMLGQGAKPVLAYATDGETTEIYTSPADKVRRILGGAFYLVPTASMQIAPQDRATYTLGMAIKGSAAQAGELLRRAVSLPRDRATLRHFLSLTMNSGTFPGPTTSADGSTTYTWLTAPTAPTPTPELVRYAISVDPKGVTTAALGPAFGLANGGEVELKLGPARSFLLEAPEMPDLPRENLASFCQADVVRLVTQATQLLKPAIEGAAE